MTAVEFDIKNLKESIKILYREPYKKRALDIFDYIIEHKESFFENAIFLGIVKQINDILEQEDLI